MLCSWCRDSWGHARLGYSLHLFYTLLQCLSNSPGIHRDHSWGTSHGISMASRHLHHSCPGPQCCVSAWPCLEERLHLHMWQGWSRAHSCRFVTMALLSLIQTTALAGALRHKEGKCPGEVGQPHNWDAHNVRASDWYITHLSHTATSFPQPGSLYKFVIHRACCSSSSNYALSSVGTSVLVLVEVTGMLLLPVWHP